MAATAVPTIALVPSADATLDGKGALLYKLESNESGCACKGTSGCGILKEVWNSDVAGTTSHPLAELTERVGVIHVGFDN
jgi:hypothetical protein